MRSAGIEPTKRVVLVGVQGNLESPFVASSTYIVPYKKPLIMQETTNNAKKLLPLPYVADLI